PNAPPEPMSLSNNGANGMQNKSGQQQGMPRMDGMQNQNFNQQGAYNGLPDLAPQRLDYTANLTSDVFGAQLFTGTFARQGATQFNPDYLISTGDRLQVRMWGGFNFDSVLQVDPQGNNFLPQVGPVKVLGVRN